AIDRNDSSASVQTWRSLAFTSTFSGDRTRSKVVCTKAFEVIFVVTAWAVTQAAGCDAVVW
ncbi:hypothetical protein, partial [Pseudomonas viridiflava]|uniref:hypothetical protein n=1 Tax=Pseudomonas viridiflava TaxID=33069 RepID=UPI001981CA92